MTGRPLLLVGGTFDPVHVGHIHLAREAARAIGAWRTIFIPAGRSPHRPQSPAASGEERHRMVELAVRDFKDAEVSRVEIDRPPPSWFIDTLRELRAQTPMETPLRFLIGADQAASLHSWREPQAILDLAQPVIVMREPWTRAELRAEIARRFPSLDEGAIDEWIINTDLLSVSSTEIRERVRDGKPIDRLVAPAVAQYIRERGLYRRAT